VDFGLIDGTGRLLGESFPPREYLPCDQAIWESAYGAYREAMQPGFRADLSERA